MNISPYVMPGMYVAPQARKKTKRYFYEMWEKNKSTDTVKMVVCERFGITVQDLESKCRKRHLVMARKYYTICALMQDKSLALIGRDPGGRDHSTIVHERDGMLDECITYPKEKRELLEFLSSINQDWGAELELMIRHRQRGELGMPKTTSLKKVDPNLVTGRKRV